MENEVVVTLHYGKKAIDLALPLDIHCRVLAKAVMEALGDIPLQEMDYSFYQLTQGKQMALSPSTTLDSAHVLYGSILRLEARKLTAAGKKKTTLPYLKIENGETYWIAEGELFIGRKSKKGTVRVGLDLSRYKNSGSAYVSRPHAKLYQIEGVFYLTDLKSRNGTWVNNERLSPGKAHPIRDGDEIRLGPEGKGVIMKFHLPINQTKNSNGGKP